MVENGERGVSHPFLDSVLRCDRERPPPISLIVKVQPRKNLHCKMSLIIELDENHLIYHDKLSGKSPYPLNYIYLQFT